MAVSRHKHAARRAPRKRLRTAQSILPALGLVAVGAAGGAAIIHDGSTGPTTSTVAANSTANVKKDLFAASVSEGAVPPRVSRSAERPPVPNTVEVEDEIKGVRFAVVPLEVHADAAAASPVLAKVDSGKTVDITGETKDGWAEVIHKGLPRWVEAKSIAAQMPLGTEPCPIGSERGLKPDTVKVLRAVCEKFPAVRAYGGIAGRGEHATGHALDIMVGNGNPLGDDIAVFLQENRAKLGIEYLIWKQRIWRPATSNSWRGMSDRGGATANHYDHVHVTTYGNSAP